MKTFTKEQLIIIKLANALSRMIDAAELWSIYIPVIDICKCNSKRIF